MEGKKRTLADILSKSDELHYDTIDRIITGEAGRLPSTADAADRYDININTAKKVYAELAKLGLITQRRRAGSFAEDVFDERQVGTYLAAKDRVMRAVRSMEFSGLPSNVIAACLVSALKGADAHGGGIVYTERDFNELSIGARELEETFGVSVTPLFLDDVLERIRAGTLDQRIIVTTFSCEQVLRDAGGGRRVVPLRVTPPLEQLVNFHQISRTTNIVLVAVGDDARTRITDTYASLIRKFPFFSVVTVTDAMRDAAVVKQAEMVLCLKGFYLDHQDLFARVPRVITYNRFHDEEGFRLLGGLLGTRS